MLVKSVRNFDCIGAVTCLSLLVILVTAQVLMRVIFLAPLIGAEELARYLLICVVFLGASFSERAGGQIRMEELLNLLPKSLKLFLQILIQSSAIIVFFIVSVGSIITLIENLKNRTATLSIPFPIFILPTVIGFCLLTLEYGKSLVRLVKSLSTPKDSQKG
jgi:TRAP-type C4-dicarboxylate transport system permease small subunit